MFMICSVVRFSVSFSRLDDHGDAVHGDGGGADDALLFFLSLEGRGEAMPRSTVPSMVPVTPSGGVRTAAR